MQVSNSDPYPKPDLWLLWFFLGNLLAKLARQTPWQVGQSTACPLAQSRDPNDHRPILEDLLHRGVGATDHLEFEPREVSPYDTAEESDNQPYCCNEVQGQVQSLWNNLTNTRCRNLRRENNRHNINQEKDI